MIERTQLRRCVHGRSRSGQRRSHCQQTTSKSNNKYPEKVWKNPPSDRPINRTDMLENLEISALKLLQKPTKTANTTQVSVNTPRRTFRSSKVAGWIAYFDIGWLMTSLVEHMLNRQLVSG